MNVGIAVLAVPALLFILVTLSSLCGGIIGWVVDLFFPFITVTLNKIAGTSLTAFEMGATLGFLSPFFKSTSTKND